MRKEDVRFINGKGPWGIPEYAGSVNLKPIVTPVPPGCYKYYFNSTGDFVCSRDTTVDEETVEDIVFFCVASNEYNAIRKFNQHQIKLSKYEKDNHSNSPG